MKENILLSILFLYTFLLFGNNNSSNIKIVNYDLIVRPDFEEEKLYVEGEITIKNADQTPAQTISLSLYRLLKFTEITTENENQILFDQKIITYEDFPVYQVNFATLTLPNALPPNATLNLKIKYEGYILGYAETGMAYIRDRINSNFSIIRVDCNAFPEIGAVSQKKSRESGLPEFNYNLKVIVPDSLIVANGGNLVRQRKWNNLLEYEYENILPAWRMDIAIAKYNIAESNGLRIFYFPEDSIGNKNIVTAFNTAIDQFTNWWGPLKNFNGFTIIEVPDGYGSQADVTSIIQSAATFKDKTQLRQLYHEISHLWNVKEKEKYPVRWNEGLATFIEYYMIEKLENKNVLEYYRAWFYNKLIEETERDKILKNTAFIKLGENGISHYSYTLGMIAFNLLHDLMGEKNFHTLIRNFYEKYNSDKASLTDLITLAKENPDMDLNKFFNDWFLSADYVLLIKNKSYEQLLEHYMASK